MLSFLRKKFALSYAALVAGCLTISAFLLVPHQAHAGFLDILSPSQLVSGIIRVLAYVVVYILGLVFQFGALLVNFMFTLNASILQNNQLVTIGWGVMRDIANLGFVLVIIIIAIATIIRVQSYGAQRLLPKLIAAAILVNFSLAISGVFINFSDTLTNFFMKQITSGTSVDLATQITGAFGMQRFTIGDTNPTPPDPADQADGVTQFGVSVLNSLASAAFSIVFISIGALVMFMFAFMLLVRYLHLSFLLVIVPIVWLFWVFPALSGQFSKWWNKFIQWTFFSPIVVFFVYLALAAARGLATQPINIAGSGLAAALQVILSQGAQMIVLCGIMIGGLLMAQSMGIAGATAGVNFAKKAGKGVQGWASRTVGQRATQLGTGVARTQWAKGLSENLQKQPTSRVGRAFNVLTGRVTQRLGAGIGSMAQRGEGLTKEAEKQLPKDDKRAAQAINTMTAPEKVATIARLTKNGKLDHLEHPEQYLTEANKELFTRYGKEKDFKTFETSMGRNVNMEKILKSEGTQEQKMAALDEERTKFYGGLTPEDAKKLPTGTLFSEKKDPKTGKTGYDSKLGLNTESVALLREAEMKGIALKDPGLLTVLLKNTDRESRKSVYSAISRVSVNLRQSTNPDEEARKTEQDAGEAVKDLDDRLTGMLRFTKYKTDVDEDEGKKGDDKKEDEPKEEGEEINMLDITENELLDRVDELPEPLKDALFSPEVGDTVKKIASYHHLSDEKGQTLLLLVGDVLYGFLHYTDFVRSLREDIGIDARVAEELDQEVDKKIFSGLRNELKQAYRPPSGMRPSASVSETSSRAINIESLGSPSASRPVSVRPSTVPQVEAVPRKPAPGDGPLVIQSETPVPGSPAEAVAHKKPFSFSFKLFQPTSKPQQPQTPKAVVQTPDGRVVPAPQGRVVHTSAFKTMLPFSVGSQNQSVSLDTLKVSRPSIPPAAPKPPVPPAPRENVFAKPIAAIQPSAASPVPSVPPPPKPLFQNREEKPQPRVDGNTIDLRNPGMPKPQSPL